MAIVAVNGCGAVGRAFIKQAILAAAEPQPRTHIKPLLVNDPNIANTKVLLEHIVNSARDRGDRKTLRDNISVRADNELSVADLELPNAPADFICTSHPSTLRLTNYRHPRELAGVYAELKATHEDPTLMVVDCSRFAAENPEFAQAHLEAGASRVVISAVAKKSDIMVVYGANQDGLTLEHKVISSASCTTNCAALPLSVIHREFTIKKGWLFTAHATTTEQAIYDLPPDQGEDRKRRSLFTGMIPTTTGAAKAVGEILGIGSLVDGMALRVPIGNGSFLSATLEVEKNVDTKTLHAVLRSASETALKGVMAFVDRGLVLDDVLIEHADVPSVVDARFTRVSNGSIIVSAWYDNVDGFTANLINLVGAVAHLGFKRPLLDANRF